MSKLLAGLMAALLVLGLMLPYGLPIREETTMAKEERQYTVPSQQELRERLTPLQYQVTQEAGTERPFTNEYWQNTQPGLYVDIVTGQPLFTSLQKYQSSCGWPAFFESIEAGRIQEIEDLSFGMRRTEVRSSLGQTHLGHVFENDPESPNGVRYCINSASLRFIPLEEMELEGYGAYLKLFSQETGE